MSTAHENNKAAKVKASGAREETKSEWTGWKSRLIIGISCFVLTIIIVVVFKPNFFYSLLIGSLTLLGASKIKTFKGSERLVWIWPSVLTFIGWAIFAGVLLNSGIGQLVESSINNAEVAAHCAVETNQTDKVCVERRQKAEKERRAAIERQALLRASQTTRVLKAAVVTPCTGVYAKKELCRVVDLAHNGARHTLPYIPAEKCWVLWVPFDDALGFDKVPDGTEVWAKSRDITAQLFVMNVGEPAFIDPRNGHKYVCP